MPICLIIQARMRSLHCWVIFWDDLCFLISSECNIVMSSRLLAPHKIFHQRRKKWQQYWTVMSFSAFWSAKSPPKTFSHYDGPFCCLNSVFSLERYIYYAIDKLNWVNVVARCVVISIPSHDPSLHGLQSPGKANKLVRVNIEYLPGDNNQNISRIKTSVSS